MRRWHFSAHCTYIRHSGNVSFVNN